MSNSPYRASPTRGLSNDSLSRTNSLPLGMNTIDGPVQIRLPNPRAHKKAQHWRTSVASTNSDYYNQWRPQLSPLVRVHSIGSGINLPGQSAASLDTISEYEMREFGGDDIDQEYKSPLVRPHVSQRNSINADPSMFRYTPTPILDPQRQTVPTPLSRPTTPQIGSGGYAQPTPSIYLNSPPENGYNNKVANSNFLKASSQAIHVSAAANNQFLPLFLNPETGNVYMFEDGFYIPIPSKNVQELEKATNINSNVLTKAPTPVSSLRERERERERERDCIFDGCSLALLQKAIVEWSGLSR